MLLGPEGNCYSCQGSCGMNLFEPIAFVVLVGGSIALLAITILVSIRLFKRRLLLLSDDSVHR